MTAAERIERIITGVIQQALTDAQETSLLIRGNGADAQLLRRWCARWPEAAAEGSIGLDLHPVSKTALLLGENPRAAVLPFGDLYYTEVVQLAGAAELSPAVQELADACEGAGALDEALRNYFDERASWPHATLHLNPRARDLLQQHLNAARFRRARLGLIPKLGARTLGIDLYA